MQRVGNIKARIEKVFLLYLPLLCIMLFITLPFYWTIVMSVTKEGDIMKMPRSYIPKSPTFENYIKAWVHVGFSKYFMNSVIIAVSVVAIIIVCAVLVGYGLSRFNFKGKKAFLLMLLCTQFVPGALLLIPLFMIYKHLGLINNPLSLIITYVNFDLPFAAIMMRGFMSNIPIQLEEAAMIDGCNRVNAIFRVILPILTPGIVASASFAFISSWKEFLFALMLTTSPKKFTIPVGLSYMQGEFNINYGILAAGCIIAAIPAILIFAYIQKYLVHGLGGAVKG